MPIAAATAAALRHHPPGGLPLPHEQESTMAMATQQTAVPAATASPAASVLGGGEPEIRGPLVSRRLRWTATAATLTLLPSGLWRIAIACGWDSGFRDEALHPSNFPGRYSFYLIALSIFAELVGMLTLGLVQRWGEVLPRWVPWLGGRRIPAMAAVIPASLGALLVTLVTVGGAFGWNDADNMGHPDSPQGAKYWIMTASYAPLMLWGPLLAIVTVAYYRRRKQHG
ncbi:hypothetical protein [Yinghuangia soli]|uniref:DUF3995 domain-containing protein n=1 Tax=Yinghuangia soli TaxID=2908204 RepID=A0AA41Q142_9ACTN|nr:hypothetical protein [Yinghuangia soli]MCF2528132.1 hypothetical protein [Yinghuangia soli]